MNPLIVSILTKLKIRRKAIKPDVLRPVFVSGAVPIGTKASFLPQENSPISLEIARLAEQLRSNEATLANLQYQFAALRAENSWLKHRCAAEPENYLPPRDPASDSGDFTPQLEQPPAVVFDYPSDESPAKSRLIYAGMGIVLFLMGLTSGYFAFGTTTFAPPTPGQTQPQSNLRSAATGEVVEPAMHAPAYSVRKSDPDVTPSAASAKPPGAAPGGTFYRVVRSTEVFRQPDTSSPAVAEIKSGMKVKVVATRGEWLQVRSLYGRPPGYIRKDTAVKTGVG